MHDLLWAFCHLWVLFFSASTLHMLYFVESCSAHQLLNLCWNFCNVKKSVCRVVGGAKNPEIYSMFHLLKRVTSLYLHSTLRLWICHWKYWISVCLTAFCKIYHIFDKNLHTKISILKLIKCKIIPKYLYLNKLQYLKEFCHRLSHHWKHMGIPPTHYHLSNGESLECREQ